MSEAGQTDVLVTRAREGDRGAYDELFVRVRGRLLRYIKLRLGRLTAKVDAQDVLQETYLDAHRSFPQFKGLNEGAFCPWIYRIADHSLHDLVDHHGAKKRRPATEAGWASEAAVERVRASQTGPASACARQEARDKLASAIEALDDEEREAVLLRYFQERTLEEVAQIMGKSTTTVWRLLVQTKVKVGLALREG